MVHLRIVHFNDVYLLDYFPHLATLINQAKNGSLPKPLKSWNPPKQGLSEEIVKTELKELPSKGVLSQGKPDECLVICSGDFLAPSLLASIDSGYGITQILNAIGVDYVCLGNHDGDAGFVEFQRRHQESSFQWINTNIPFETLEMPKNVIVEVKKNEVVKKVGLIGLCLQTNSMWLPSSAFSMAKKSFIPTIQAAKSEYETLKDQVDLVIPLTHVLQPEDLEILKTGLFPITLGGHEHDVQLNSIEIDGQDYYNLKAGCEGEFAYIVDLVWNHKDKTPNISFQLYPSMLFEPDSDISALKDVHEAKVKALQSIVLYKNRDNHFQPLSSINPRSKVTTMTKLLATHLKTYFNTQCALINAGAIRLEKEWQEERFTLADLTTLFPYQMDVVTLTLPGKLIKEALDFTHRPVYSGQSSSMKSFFQHDKDLVTKLVDKKTGKLADESTDVNDLRQWIWEIDGETFDLDNLYSITLLYDVFNGLDKVQPLIDFAKENQHLIQLLHNDAIPIKVALVGFYAKRAWKLMPTWNHLDTDNSGSLDKSEVKQVFIETLGKNLYGSELSQVEKMAIEQMVDAMVSSLDLNQDGYISREEYNLLFQKESNSDI